MTREHLHLGQQVLTGTVPGQVTSDGGERLQGWTAAPSWKHFLLSKYRTRVSSHTGWTSPNPQVPPQGPLCPLIHSDSELGNPIILS